VALSLDVRDCVALARAVRVAEWVGSGKPVTPKGVLRPADVRQAATMIEVRVPEKFRSAADVPAWHRLWSVALATGMVSIEQGRATAGPPVDVTPELWLTGLVAALAAAFGDEESVAAIRVGRAALTALATGKARSAIELYEVVWGDLQHDYDFNYWRLQETGGYEKSGELLIELFAEFGACTERAQLTDLGKWALSQVVARGDGIAASPSAVESDRVCQLKITLKNVQPACWRRVLVPATATLGSLHWIIQAAMRWDNDHLHGFTVGQRRYGDPGYDMSDEYEIAVGEAFTHSRKTIGYTYDFGDDWRHDITLEKTLDVDADAKYPVCVAGSGAVPVEDSHRKMIKFDQDDINRRLGALPDLEEEDTFDKVIEMIIVDASDDDEQLSAFVTVFEDEVTLPAEASLLGSPVTVLEFDHAEMLRGPFVRCRSAHGEGEIALADVCFPADTVAAWIHAAYRHYLGLEPFPATPRPGWSWP
jgi:hypothetical protein